MPEKGNYVFTFTARRRKPNPEYDGILRTHRFFIEYYSLLEGQRPAKVIRDGIPRIAFPARFTEIVLDFVKELDGEIVEVRRVKIPRKDLYYEKPVVLLPNELAFRRHMLFSLTLSTYRKQTSVRFNSLRNLLLTMNANLLNILSAMALDRYEELRSSQNAAWHWYMLRVGRALKVLYKLD